MEMSEKHDVQVISIKRAFSYRKTEDNKQKLCTHIAVIVDEATRTIECDECGIILDPFDYLRKVCYQEEHAFQRLDALKAELPKLEKQYQRLSREVQKLRGEKIMLKNT